MSYSFRSRVLRGTTLAAIAAAAAYGPSPIGCAATEERTFSDDVPPAASGGQGGAAAASVGSSSNDGEDLSTGIGSSCAGLECNQVECMGGATTTVSGTVWSPKGDLPLYNVVVYVPNAPLEPIAEGASCDQCGSTLSGAPLVTALTDTSGKFKLENVPAGEDIPLVIQVGKWRREVVIPSVKECVDNPIENNDLTRLPRNSSEGHIPKIALSTGGADALECLLRKVGIDDAEFTPDTGPGRVHLFKGYKGAEKLAPSLGGAPLNPSHTALWKDLETLKKYDVVLLSCEGTPQELTKPEAALKAMFDYTSLGGRVFMSHWNNYWLEAGPDPFPKTAVFHHQNDLPDPTTGYVDTSFPKGGAMADWLFVVGASKIKGELPLKEGQHTVDAATPGISQRWIYSKAPASVQYITFNTPVGVDEEKQCGRVVFSDIHVSSGDKYGEDFPSGCVTSSLSPQEAALVFMLFDLTACLQSDSDEPVPPPK